MIYAARFDTMNALLGFLTENCCGDRGSARQPSLASPRAAHKSCRHEGGPPHD